MKSHFHEADRTDLNKELDRINQKGKHLEKLKQPFITCINIKANKALMNKSLHDVYMEFSTINSCNRDVIKIAMKDPEFAKKLNRPYKEAFT